MEWAPGGAVLAVVPCPLVWSWAAGWELWNQAREGVLAGVLPLLPEVELGLPEKDSCGR